MPARALSHSADAHVSESALSTHLRTLHDQDAPRTRIAGVTFDALAQSHCNDGLDRYNVHAKSRCKAFTERGALLAAD